jgi:hypothetical protein
MGSVVSTLTNTAATVAYCLLSPFWLRAWPPVQLGYLILKRTVLRSNNLNQPITLPTEDQVREGGTPASQRTQQAPGQQVATSRVERVHVHGQRPPTTAHKHTHTTCNRYCLHTQVREGGTPASQRTFEGSGNNSSVRTMGMSGCPFARNTPKRAADASVGPDVGEVSEQLLARPGGVTKTKPLVNLLGGVCWNTG